MKRKNSLKNCVDQIEKLTFPYSDKLPMARGVKTVTIRVGEKYEGATGLNRIIHPTFGKRQDLSPEATILIVGEETDEGGVKMPRYDGIAKVPQALLYADGYRSWKTALRGLREFYPDLTENDPVFAILFANNQLRNHLGGPSSDFMDRPEDVLKNLSLRESFWPSVAIGFIKHLEWESQYIDVSDAFALWAKFLRRERLATGEEYQSHKEKLSMLHKDVPDFVELAIMTGLMERLISGNPMSGDRTTIEELICLREPTAALAAPLVERVKDRQNLLDKSPRRRRKKINK